jgi:hypothetical protein
VKDLINKVMKKLAVFPIAFEISHFPIVLLLTLNLFMDNLPSILMKISRIFLSLNGFLFAIIYLFFN